MENPITTVTAASKGVTIPFIWKTFLALLAIALIFAFVYWFIWLRGLSWPKIKLLISEESVKSDNPVNAEHVLMQGVKEIVTDPNLFLQARDYAKTSGIPLERVLVNNALALAKSFQYINLTA